MECWSCERSYDPASQRLRVPAVVGWSVTHDYTAGVNILRSVPGPPTQACCKDSRLKPPLPTTASSVRSTSPQTGCTRPRAAGMGFSQDTGCTAAAFGNALACRKYMYSVLRVVKWQTGHEPDRRGDRPGEATQLLNTTICSVLALYVLREDRAD